jgi:hypothetical protein
MNDVVHVLRYEETAVVYSSDGRLIGQARQRPGYSDYKGKRPWNCFLGTANHPGGVIIASCEWDAITRLALVAKQLAPIAADVDCPTCHGTRTDSHGLSCPDCQPWQPDPRD